MKNSTLIPSFTEFISSIEKDPVYNYKKIMESIIACEVACAKMISGQSLIALKITKTMKQPALCAQKLLQNQFKIPPIISLLNISTNKYNTIIDQFMTQNILNKNWLPLDALYYESKNLNYTVHQWISTLTDVILSLLSSKDPLTEKTIYSFTLLFLGHVEDLLSLTQRLIKMCEIYIPHHSPKEMISPSSLASLIKLEDKWNEPSFKNRDYTHIILNKLKELKKLQPTDKTKNKYTDNIPPKPWLSHELTNRKQMKAKKYTRRTKKDK